MSDACRLCGGKELTSSYTESGMCQLCLEPSFAPMVLATLVSESLAHNDPRGAAAYCAPLNAWLAYTAGQPVDGE